MRAVAMFSRRRPRASSSQFGNRVNLIWLALGIQMRPIYLYPLHFLAKQPMRGVFLADARTEGDLEHHNGHSEKICVGNWLMNQAGFLVKLMAIFARKTYIENWDTWKFRK